MRLGPMSDELSRLTRESDRRDSTSGSQFHVTKPTGASANAFDWNIGDTKSSLLGTRKQADSENSFGRADSFPLTDWQPFDADADDDVWGAPDKAHGADRTRSHSHVEDRGVKQLQSYGGGHDDRFRPSTPSTAVHGLDSAAINTPMSQPTGRVSERMQNIITPRSLQGRSTVTSDHSARLLRSAYALTKPESVLGKRNQAASSVRMHPDVTLDSWPVDDGSPIKQRSSANSDVSNIDNYRLKSSLQSAQQSSASDIDKLNTTSTTVGTSMDISRISDASHSKPLGGRPVTNIIDDNRDNVRVHESQSQHHSPSSSSPKRNRKWYSARILGSDSNVANKSDNSGKQSSHSSMDSRTQQLIQRQQQMKTRKAARRGRSPVPSVASSSVSKPSGYFGRTHPARPKSVERTPRKKPLVLPKSRATPPEPLFGEGISDHGIDGVDVNNSNDVYEDNDDDDDDYSYKVNRHKRERQKNKQRSKNEGSSSSTNAFKFQQRKASSGGSSAPSSGGHSYSMSSVYQKFKGTLGSKNSALFDRLKSVREARLRRAASRSPRSVVEPRGIIGMQHSSSSSKNSANNNKYNSNASRSFFDRSFSTPETDDSAPNPYSPPKPFRLSGGMAQQTMAFDQRNQRNESFFGQQQKRKPQLMGGVETPPYQYGHFQQYENGQLNDNNSLSTLGRHHMDAMLLNVE